VVAVLGTLVARCALRRFYEDIVFYSQSLLFGLLLSALVAYPSQRDAFFAVDIVIALYLLVGDLYSAQLIDRARDVQKEVLRVQKAMLRRRRPSRSTVLYNSLAQGGNMTGDASKGREIEQGMSNAVDGDNIENIDLEDSNDVESGRVTEEIARWEVDLQRRDALSQGFRVSLQHACIRPTNNTISINSSSDNNGMSGNATDSYRTDLRMDMFTNVHHLVDSSSCHIYTGMLGHIPCCTCLTINVLCI
jgi:hypothetical protein